MIPNNPGKSQDRNFTLVIGLALTSMLAGVIGAIVHDYYICFGTFLTIGLCIGYVVFLDNPNPDTTFPSGSEYYINDDLGEKK